MTNRDTMKDPESEKRAKHPEHYEPRKGAPGAPDRDKSKQDKMRK